MDYSKRYSRHLELEEIGEEGQSRICSSKVLVVGAGGLGSPICLYLAAAGVGTLGIMDDDRVSESNLQRQILYDSNCIGRPKVEIACKRLQALNPDCNVIAMDCRLSAGNAADIIRGFDVVVDATDNLKTRYVMDDACKACGRPFVYGSICEFRGQVSVFNYQGGPCYRDLYPYDENVEDYRQPVGVLGALPGAIGSIEATEAIKVILGSEDTLSGRLLLADLMKGSFHILKIGWSPTAGSTATTAPPADNPRNI